MKVVIIEDEALAAERLKKLLGDISPEIEVIEILRSFHESMGWLANNHAPDLILMDIDLGDGSSMDIIKQVKISCPVIFITAYNEYWQEAFEHHGIDYLLKPLHEERLQAALSKLNELKEHFLSKINGPSSPHESKFKDRFLVKRGSKFVSIRTQDISYFYASAKLSFLVERASAKFALDLSLSEIKSSLDPGSFFRVNRRYLVNKNAITSIRGLPKSRIMIRVTPSASEDVIISSENSAEFKKWLGK